MGYDDRYRCDVGVSIPYGKWSQEHETTMVTISEFQYTMGNGAQEDHYQAVKGLGFNTLWEMEPLWYGSNAEEVEVSIPYGKWSP